MHHVNDSSGSVSKTFWAIVLFAALLSVRGELIAQGEARGEIRGRVVSGESGEPIIGATVMIMGTSTGTATDLNGVFTIRNVRSGRHAIVVSSIGFASQQIDDVDVDGGVTVVDVVLEEVLFETEGAVVTGRTNKGTEAGLLASRRRAPTVTDGISRSQIQRSPDATGGDAIARVTGMSVVGGRFISVRGTNERYNTTQVNGVEMPSTDPDKKSFSFDMFPANLLENMIVSKTFTPDMPGNFTGGFVQLNTVDFPDARTIRLTVSGSFDPKTTFNPINVGARSTTDWLGFDDGLRALPEGIPSSDIYRDSLSSDEQYDFARRFSNTWAPVVLDAPPNASFLISYGDRYRILANDLGIIAALSYRNSYQRQDIVRREEAVFDYHGFENTYEVLWGGMLNLSYKLSDLNTISLRNLYNRTAEDSYTELEGEDIHNSQLRKLNGSSFLERSFYSGQLSGEHVVPALNSIRFEWKASGSIGERDEPDFRRATFVRNDSAEPYLLTLFDAASWKSVGRTFNHLDEEVFGFNGDVTLPIGKVTLKAGGAVENKTRTFFQRAFSYGSKSSQWKLTTAAIDTVFLPEHIAPDQIFVVEQTVPSMRYDAHSNLNAAYLMGDIPLDLLVDDLRLILGARIEEMGLTMNSASNADNSAVGADYGQTDLLPSISLIYAATPKLNIRTAFSRTITRPEFREYAPFSFYDFETGQDIYGNPGLRRALSTNYDLRVEFFPGPGEVAAISLFHKDIDDAIEQVAIAGLAIINPQVTWNNADQATNTGIELELRKSLGFIGDLLAPFSLSANYTWLESKSIVVGDSLRASKTGRLQGQSPYMINAGLYYDNLDLGTSISILYNRFGARILEVTSASPNDAATHSRPDFVEQPQDLLDFSITQRLFSRLDMKATLKNILGEDQVFTQGETPARVNERSISVGLGLSLRL